MKKEIKTIQYSCNHCDEIILRGTQCLLAIGDKTSFKHHHFCDAQCLAFFINNKQGVHTTRIRDLLFTKEFDH